MKATKADYADIFQAFIGSEGFTPEDARDLMERAGRKLAIHTIRKKLYEFYQDTFLTRPVSDERIYTINAKQIEALRMAYKAQMQGGKRRLGKRDDGIKQMQWGQSFRGKAGDKVAMIGA
jgi:hypothetical protein